jgi:galactan endo-1,6-beta-galactosidase
MVFSPIPHVAGAATARPDPAKSWGTWEGWGTSLSWCATVFGSRDDAADLLFTTGTVTMAGEKLPGLGLNIARYNAGACSGNDIGGRKMIVSKTIRRFRQIEGFWLDPRDPNPASTAWDWAADANQRTMLQKARDRGANLFELFSNSPMWWMCGNDNPSGAAGKDQDNLPPRNYRAFATCLATIAAHAKAQWGIRFTSIEPFNEPTSKNWFADCKQEGCHFDAVSQAAFLPIFRAELDRQGLRDLPIAASDESFTDQAISVWKSFPPAIKALVSKVNVHGYQGAGGARDVLYHLAHEADGKQVWNSEHGDTDGTGLKLAHELSLDMRFLHPTAWCYWQPFDERGWGLVKSDLAAKKYLAVNPKYYVLAQYTRHIRPGMQILDSGAVDTVAAYDGRAHKLVLVVYNAGQARAWSCDLSRFRTVQGPVACWMTEPKATARYEKRDAVQLNGKSLGCAVPADSVETFEVDNVLP